MRSILLTLVVLLFALTSNAQHGATDMVGKTEEVVFTKDMNQKSLDLIRTELHGRGVHLKYEDLKFSPEGQLQSISFEVKGSGSDSLHHASAELSEGVNFGFEVQHNGKQAVVTKSGVLPAAAPVEKGH